MRLISLHRNDRGSALIAVVGIVLVTIAIAVTISATTVQALHRTDGTRDTVTQEFAAEAGVAVAQNDLAAGACATHGPIYESGDATGPFYRAVVVRHTPTGSELGCPVDNQGVSIISTGYASAADYNSRSTERRSVEARFTRSPVPLLSTGPAVFADSMVTLGGNGTLVGETSLDPTIHVRTGNITCNGTSAGGADIVLEAGDLYAQAGCDIGGNIWTVGTADIKAGIIDGNVVATTVIAEGGVVNGSVWATSGATAKGTAQFKQNLTVLGNLAYDGADVGVEPPGTPTHGNVWVTGDAAIANNARDDIFGHLYAATASGDTGRISPKTIGGVIGAPTAPTKPTVANWINLAYDPDMWHGFVPITMTGNCNGAALVAAVSSLAGQKGVINALDCAGAVDLGSTMVTIENDLAIFAKHFSLGGNSGFTSADDDQLWLLNPDTDPESPAEPDCNGQTMDIDGNRFTLGTPVMFYTPCTIRFTSGLAFEGQIFAGSFINNGATMTFKQAGLPGYDLSTGNPVSPSAPRELTSYLNTPRFAEEWMPAPSPGGP